MNSRNKTIFSILLLFFLAALIMGRQLKSSAYFSCSITDTYIYTSWASQFIEALKEGIIYPRWTPLNFWGYGSPTFILYSPLAFYLVAFFNFFTDSVIVAMNITKFAALFFSATGMFFLVKEFYSDRVALLSASFYILQPYNIFGVYHSGAFASKISLMWLSPILIFIYRYIKDRYYKHIIYAGVCYSGLILTHLINAYMFTFVILLFVIYMSVTKNRPGYSIAIPVIIITGILISAAYILPLIFEKQFINLNAFIGKGDVFHYSNFFIFPKFSSDHIWQVYYNTYVFFVFFFCILLLLFLLQILKLDHIKAGEDVEALNRFFLGIAAISMFLLFGVSTFVWETIPFFKYIQLPVRWLYVTTFSVAFLSATIFYMLEAIHKTKIGHHFIVGILFLICLLLDYKYINSAHIFEEQEVIPLKGENWALEHLPLGANIDKIDKNSEYKEKVFIIKGEGKVEIIAWKSAERVIEITASKPITLRIRIFNFPGWKAYMDGTEISIRTESGVGAMVIDIPKGQHKLELRFVDTPIRYYSKIISLVSCLLLSLFVLLPKKKNQRYY